MSLALQSRWAHRLRKNSIQILAYHSISSEVDDDLTVSPADFRDQMEQLVDSGIEVISLADALARLAQHQPLRSRVVVTFDDAYADFLDNALPILDQHRMLSTVFAVTKKLNQKSDWNHDSLPRWTMSVENLRFLIDRGHAVGSHTATHRRLTTLTDAEVETELVTSKSFLESTLGVTRPLLAYPFGDYGQREARAAERCGFACACGTGGFWGNDYDTGPFSLHRLIIRRRYSLAEFRSITSSIWKWPLIKWPAVV